MRVAALVVAIVAGACDFQPPPPKPPAAPPPPAAAADAQLEEVARPKPDAGDVSQPCLDAATHFAEVLIAATTDQTQRAALEQDRARLVRKTAEACTSKWSDGARACYAAAHDLKDLEGCGKLVAPANAGSAAR